MANDVLWLSEADVESLNIPMTDVIAAVEQGWRLKGEGSGDAAKIGIHPATIVTYMRCPAGSAER